MRHFGYTMDDSIFRWRNQKLDYLVADASKSIPPQNYYNTVYACVCVCVFCIGTCVYCYWCAVIVFAAVLYAIDRRDSDSKAMAKRSNYDFDRIQFEK